MIVKLYPAFEIFAIPHRAFSLELAVGKDAGETVLHGACSHQDFRNGLV
jgi:hypothetical protein